MRVKDILRAAVVKTNPYWPFSGLNRMPYHLAIKAFVRLCKRFPEIKSVYLRHGLIQGNWVPGISDIDLTVITDSKLNMEEEFYLLRSFWKGYDSLKKLFPVLGEAEVLNEEHIGSWTKFSIQGYESSRWRLVYGMETVRSSYIPSSQRLTIDSINYALTNYLGYFPRKFYEHEHPDYLTLRELYRLASKVLRYINYSDNSDIEKHKIDGRFTGKVDALCCIVRALEKRIQYFSSYNDSAEFRADAESGSKATGHKVNFDDYKPDINNSTPCHAALEGVFLARYRNFIVLKDRLGCEVIRDCMNEITGISGRLDPTSVIVSSSVFKYILRSYDPFLYAYLLESGKSVVGNSLLADVQPPDISVVAKKIVEQTPNVLTFPQRRATVSASGTNLFTERKFESMMERALFIKLYLEKGVIKSWHEELLAECRGYYPHYYKKLKELKENAGCVSDEALNREAFELMKGIACDIHKSVSTSSVMDNLFKMNEGEESAR